MQANQSILGTTTFGTPGGSHVTISTNGSITGYYADGRKAYDLVPGSNAAISAYADQPGTPAKVQLANGGINFFPTPLIEYTIQADATPELAVTKSGRQIILQDASTGNFAWTTGSSWVTFTGVGAGWTGGVGSGVPIAQYILNNHDELLIIGALGANSATPATNIITLPAGFRPLGSWRGGADVYTSGGVWKGRVGITVASSGVVSQGGFVFTSGDIIGLDLVIPMGNI